MCSSRSSHVSRPVVRSQSKLPICAASRASSTRNRPASSRTSAGASGDAPGDGLPSTEGPPGTADGRSGPLTESCPSTGTGCVRTPAFLPWGSEPGTGCRAAVADGGRGRGGEVDAAIVRGSRVQAAGMHADPSSSVAPTGHHRTGPGSRGARACRRASAPVARVCPVRDPGTADVPVRVPERGPVVHPRRIRSAGPAAPHTFAPPGRVRSLPSRAVGGGSRREPSCSEVGRRRRCTVGGEPRGGRNRPGGCGCAGTERRSSIARGRGRPDSAGSGRAEGDVHRPAAVVARRAVRCGRHPSRIEEAVLERTSSWRSPGTWLVAPVGAIP